MLFRSRWRTRPQRRSLPRPRPPASICAARVSPFEADFDSTTGQTESYHANARLQSRRRRFAMPFSYTDPPTTSSIQAATWGSQATTLRSRSRAANILNNASSRKARAGTTSPDLGTTRSRSTIERRPHETRRGRAQNPVESQTQRTLKPQAF